MTALAAEYPNQLKQQNGQLQPRLVQLVSALVCLTVGGLALLAVLAECWQFRSWVDFFSTGHKGLQLLSAQARSLTFGPEPSPPFSATASLVDEARRQVAEAKQRRHGTSR